MFDGGSVVNERLKKQLAFILELDKIKKIGRQTYLSDASRKENDAEHSWHLAIMAVLLAEQANEKIDVLKTVTMVLIHDVVEIDAGDTYAYDSAGNESKREREERAADRIFNILPPDQANYMRALWEEFEAGETAEAKFACTLDHVQPLLLNDASAGLSWREHEIKKSQVMKRNEKTGEGSEALWEYARELIQKNTELGNLKNE
ncbi:MAG: HD domain-containing protein [Lachnospiraceae bacterium]|nr:HD domain-containing protein [Lachnospiraceae bacterium]